MNKKLISQIAAISISLALITGCNAGATGKPAPQNNNNQPSTNTQASLSTDNIGSTINTPYSLSNTQILLIDGNPNAHVIATPAVVQLFKNAIKVNYNVTLLIPQGAANPLLQTGDTYSDPLIQNTAAESTDFYFTQSELSKYESHIFDTTKSNALTALKSNYLFAVYYNGDGGTDQDSLILGNDMLRTRDLNGIDFHWNVSFIMAACEVFSAPFGPDLMYKYHARNFMAGIGELPDSNDIFTANQVFLKMLNNSEEMLSAWNEVIKNTPSLTANQRHFFQGHWGVTNGPEGHMNVDLASTSIPSYITNQWQLPESNILSVSAESVGQPGGGHSTQNYTITITNNSESSFPFSYIGVNDPLNVSSWSFSFQSVQEFDLTPLMIAPIPFTGSFYGSGLQYLATNSQYEQNPPTIASGATLSLNNSLTASTNTWGGQANYYTPDIELLPYLSWQNNPELEPNTNIN